MPNDYKSRIKCPFYIDEPDDCTLTCEGLGGYGILREQIAFKSRKAKIAYQKDNCFKYQKECQCELAAALWDEYEHES